MIRIFLLLFLIPIFFIGGCDKKSEVLNVVDKLPGFKQIAAREYATDAKRQLKSIYEASKLYRSENGTYPADVTEVNDGNYLNIPPSTLEKWDFDINICDEDGYMESITATSLEGMPGGAGHRLVFDIVNEKFTGYGQKDDGSGYK